VKLSYSITYLKIYLCCIWEARNSSETGITVISLWILQCHFDYKFRICIRLEANEFIFICKRHILWKLTCFCRLSRARPIVIYYRNPVIFLDETCGRTNITSTCCVGYVNILGSTRWCSWVRHCGTRRRAAGFHSWWCHWKFYWHNPSGRTMESTQPLIEMKY